MFNTSFSNKTQLKIKIFYLFILLGRTRFNTFLALDWTWSDQNNGECLHRSREHWSMATLFSDWVLSAIKLYFLLNQTTISVAASEPHPQP